MKKLFATLIILFSAACLFAQEAEISKKTNPLWFNLVFTEGLTYDQITRIEVQENSSNFVRETFLAGAYCNVKTDGFWLVDLELQLAAYYPFHNAFNGMAQKAKNMFNYGIDLFFGATYTFDFLKYVNIETSLGLHYMYQLTDEYHMNYVGLGTLNSIVFPITHRWSVVNSYFFAYDNPNLGTNAKVQPFDGSYQYHIDLGVRYSKASPNSYSYIMGK